MATTQFGTTLTIGAGTFGSYIVDTRDNSDFDVDREDIFDGSDGSRATRLVFNRDEKITLNLIAKSAAVPATDFPKGLKCTVTGFTNYIVEDCRVGLSKSATRVQVTLVNIGI